MSDEKKIPNDAIARELGTSAEELERAKDELSPDQAQKILGQVIDDRIQALQGGTEVVHQIW